MGQTPAAPLVPPFLMLTQRALRLVAGLGVQPDSLAHATWLVLAATAPPPGPWRPLHLVPAVNCPALREINLASRSVTAHPAGLLLLYDLEAWAFSPAQERRDPASAIRLGAAMAHNSGTWYAAAPSLTLARELRPRALSPEVAYLSSGLIDAAAPACDLLHVQSQSLERTPTRYLRFVRQVVGRARSLNPTLWITAGLSTNPPGPAVSLEQLLECVALTEGIVDGYWLNVPRPGPRCPRCRPEDPALAALLLSLLAVIGSHVGLRPSRRWQSPPTAE
ncbi:MAG: hypothetical protein ACREOL_09655 [Candidatus Dormibacteria bacterium]